MATLDLVFDRRAYPVPKRFIFDLLNHHRDLLDAATYAVQSSVPVDVFEAFLDSLKSQTKISLTADNAVSLSLLANEFFLSELVSECRTLPVSVGEFSRLSDRVCEVERQIASFSNSARALEAMIESQEEGLEGLRLAVGRSLRDFERPNSADPRRQEIRLDVVEFPMKAPNSLDGVISYLTKIHGGNIHEKEVVTLTSQSASSSGVIANLADFTSDSPFSSSSAAPDQWVCWDFRQMRIRPTAYTVWAWDLESWVVEGSLDGANWAEIDRQAGDLHFGQLRDTASFVASSPAECRFIRLTRTSNGDLNLLAVEFFGALIGSLPSRVSAIEAELQMALLKHRIEIQRDNSLGGIISYLALKHGGNVHEMGIATITSKSVYVDDPEFAPRNLADVACDSWFQSEDGPGQWVCWDFGEMRVRPTNYTIWAWELQSWVVEASVDGESWTEIDRQQDNLDFKSDWATASFAVTNPMKCRFIRLTQTDTNHQAENALLLRAVEFFGTLSA